MEIIGRLPAKSVARFLLISKLSATIIRSRDFITSFQFGSSSSQPCLLIAFNKVDSARRRQYLYFISLFFSSTSFLSRLTSPFENPEHINYPSHYVNGLIRLGFGEEQIIFNPTTGKSITLPRVINRRKMDKTYLGYDPVNDQYKVLCMTGTLHVFNHPNFQSPYHHEVLTFGARELWRVMDCSIPHSSWSNSVCIDGVLYYVAKTRDGLLQWSLMRFDVRSEKLDLLTHLPADFKAPNAFTLVKYEGKVAIMTKASLYIFDMWVMEELGWLKKSFSVDVKCVRSV